MSNGRLKEARTDGSIGFNHGRIPGGVTGRSHRWHFVKNRAEMASDAPQLRRGFTDKVSAFAARNQRFNFQIEGRDLRGIEAYRRLFLHGPAIGPGESRGIDVRRKERN